MGWIKTLQAFICSSILAHRSTALKDGWKGTFYGMDDDNIDEFAFESASVSFAVTPGLREEAFETGAASTTEAEDAGVSPRPGKVRAKRRYIKHRSTPKPRSRVGAGTKPKLKPGKNSPSSPGAVFERQGSLPKTTSLSTIKAPQKQSNARRDAALLREAKKRMERAVAADATPGRTRPSTSHKRTVLSSSHHSEGSADTQAGLNSSDAIDPEFLAALQLQTRSASGRRRAPPLWLRQPDASWVSQKLSTDELVPELSTMTGPQQQGKHRRKARRVLTPPPPPPPPPSFETAVRGPTESDTEWQTSGGDGGSSCSDWSNAEGFGYRQEESEHRRKKLLSAKVRARIRARQRPAALLREAAGYRRRHAFETSRAEPWRGPVKLMTSTPEPGTRTVVTQQASWPRIGRRGGGLHVRIAWMLHQETLGPIPPATASGP